MTFRHNHGNEMMTSNEVVVADEATLLNTTAAAAAAAVHRMRLPFVHKLYLMLNDLEAKGYDHIISWIGVGDAFKIHDPSLFEASIQPQYFRQSRLSSFIRQVSQLLECIASQTQSCRM